MKKALLSLIIAAILLVCAMPFSGVLATEGNGFVYTIENDKVTITGYNGEISGTLTIPEKIEDKPVAAIDYGAFDNQTELTGVVFPAGLKVIRERAFYGCKKLNNISLPSGLEEIGQMAFGETAHYSDDSKWDKDGVLYIGEYLIHTKRNYTGEYTIKEGTKLLANEALAYSKGFTNVVFPESLKSLSKYCLAGCNGIKSIAIPETIESIGESAFRECFGLEKVIIPSKIKEIKRTTFNNCDSLKEVVLPDGLTTIGIAAFDCCRSLESIIIPQSVTTIEMYAFFSCYKLKDVSLPDGLTVLGEKVFGQTAISRLIIPKGVTNLEMGVFSQCPNLEEIVLADTVTEIGEYAFGESTAFKTINYYGTEEQWAEVKKSESANEILFNAEIKFNYANKGDLDRSYKVNSADALFILQGATGLVTFDENQFSAADIDLDGSITSKDALSVLQFSTGLMKSL